MYYFVLNLNIYIFYFKNHFRYYILNMLCMFKLYKVFYHIFDIFGFKYYLALEQNIHISLNIN